MNINEKLATIQTDLKSKKSRFNSFGKYNYRSAEDILEAVKPFLLKLNVSVVINEKIKTEFGNFPIMETTATLSDGENAIHAIAVVGVDLDQKGMNVPQKFGSASSYAKKYALGNLFLIDDTADSDATNDHNKKQFTAKVELSSKTDPAFNKAKEYIKGGGKIEAIKAKYALSKEVEIELTTL
jgi:ribosomal protein L31